MKDINDIYHSVGYNYSNNEWYFIWQLKISKIYINTENKLCIFCRLKVFGNLCVMLVSEKREAYEKNRNALQNKIQQ